jgi:hypothetical protein
MTRTRLLAAGARLALKQTLRIHSHSLGEAHMSSPSRRGYRRWFTVLVLVGLPMALQAQSGVGGKGLDANRLGLAKRVVQASGAEAIILKSIELTLPAQRAQNPTINPEFWDRFTTKARAEIGVLVDSLAPIYARRFSKAELEQLVAFYESPVGRHIMADQGDIVQESQQLGVRWGTRLGAAIAVELANEGKAIKQ